MLKKILLALTVTVVSASGLLMAQKRQVMLDKVVAVVGGSAILYSDVETYAGLLVEQRRAQGYTSDRDPMNEALEALMKQKLLYNQAQIDSIELMGNVQSYVEEQIQGMIAEEGSIAALEARQHMPIYTFRDILTQRITEQEYASQMQEHVIGDVTVTPGEVERYFKSLKEDELPLVPKQYMYAQIVRYPSSQEVAKQRARERLLEMRERIITGKSSLPLLARLYSADPGSAMRGGELTYGPLSQWQPPFAEAAGELRRGSSRRSSRPSTACTSSN